MSDLDQILARARDPGQLTERRHFTINRTQAIEKLRQSALRRPGQVVLELIQGAVFAGASYIAVDTRSDQLVVAWVGAPPLTAQQLENLLDYLFVDSIDPELRHLVQLAVAVNAMLREEGGKVRIESGDGTPGKTLRLDLGKDETGILGVPRRALAGTYLALERPRSWWQFWKRSTTDDERVLVEEQCRYTPVPILLNGSAPFGYRSSRQVRTFHQGADLPFDEGPGGRRGSLHLAPYESRVSIVVGGVLIATVEMTELGWVQSSEWAGGVPHFFCGVVCDDRLRKTADQSDIVRDQQFDALLQALRAPSTELASRLFSGWTSPLPARVQLPDGSVTIPEQIEQLSPRSVLSLEQLRALPADLPLFCVPPSVSSEAAMREAADLTRLPFPVLCLPGAVVQPLEATLGRPIGVLMDPASADLAVRTAAGSSGRISVADRAIDGQGRVWTATVWRSVETRLLTPNGALPILVQNDGLTTHIAEVELDAPGLLLMVDRPLPDSHTASELLDLVLQHPIRLVLEDASVPLDLRCRLATRVLRLVPREDGTLDLHLPEGWHIGDLGVDLSSWIAGIQRAERITVSEDVLDCWEPLEAAFGVGFLGTTPHGRPKVVVSIQADGWAVSNEIPTDDRDHLAAWDGPPPPGHTRISPEPFLTGITTDATARRIGIEVLLDALANRLAPSPRERALIRRWKQGLEHLKPGREAGGAAPQTSAHVVGTPWGDLGDPTVSLALARAMNLDLPGLYPPWVRTGDVAGGWAVRTELQCGWLGIPRHQSPHDVRPQILVHAGARTFWMSTAHTLPCIGIVTLPPGSQDTLHRHILDLWLMLLSSPVVEAASWARFAARAVTPNSILGERLRNHGGPPRSGGESVVQRELLKSLDALSDLAEDEEWLIRQHDALLRRALGASPVQQG